MILKKRTPAMVLEFSKEQWLFLAAIAAFESPVSVDFTGRLVPLFPGPLIDLLEKTEASGWIKKTENSLLEMGKGLPAKAVEKLKTINNKKHLSMIVDRILDENLSGMLDLSSQVGIMHRAGRDLEAGMLEIDLAREVLEKNKYEEGRIHLAKAVYSLESGCKDPEIAGLFISSILQLSNISFALGKGLLKIEKFLTKAYEAAVTIGDKRSCALINLHIGRLYYFTDRRDEALVALSIGNDEIEELGDSDIHSQSAIFLGIYFFIQGEFEKAFGHLEKANCVFDSDETSMPKDPLAPIFFGYCAIYLGRFHRAIGHLDYCNRIALERSDMALSSTFRSVLGTLLVLLKKDKEAKLHLDEAQKEAGGTGNVLGLYFSMGGMALYLFAKGDVEKAYNMAVDTIKEGTRAGLIRQFASPWFLEVFYEFHQLGYDPIPHFDIADVMERVMDGVNCHLQGVCLRLKAKMLMGQGGSHMKIAEYLTKSEAKLRQSGDPVQTSKTLLEISRLELIKGHRDKARQIAKQARHMLGGYIDEFFPDEFRHLIENKEGFPDKEFKEEEFLDRYLEMIESFYPSENRMEILSKMLAATSQMFGAERSGLFWFPKGQHRAKPELRASLNLPKIEIDSSNFKPSLNIILKTFRKNHPFSEKLTLKEFSLGKKFVRSVLCIPIEVNNLPHGVLYYDNSYLDNAFEFLNLSVIKRMARHTNMVVERRMDHIKANDTVNKLAFEKSLFQDSKDAEIITQSNKVYRLLDQVDKVAGTESTVLILGETGTGKELVAKRIHKKSRRSKAPLIVVDSTTIPENLLESELFGYEKGAFTGADKRKIGCIEMADKGTLFLDEVGELPLAAQAKLLRALQEKTIRRVGGVVSIAADFRLVTATNRDLAIEVEQGRFREDLFYRLNVVPFELPPLRKRDKDSVLLSQHFINRYSKKYNFPGFELSSDEKIIIINYPWPGNIRELKNVMERAVLLSNGDRLELNLPSDKPFPSTDQFGDMPTLDEIQCRYIHHVLEYTKGKVSGPEGACEILGMKRSSFYSRIKALGFKK
jgi:transcriptional regulator with GAF, ATPase, and Fis domain